MLILRTIKGAKLTWTELDGNFTYLEDEIEAVRELADGDTLVRITPQVFLPEQRDQALVNIGAAPQSVINDIEARVEFLETIQPVTYDLQTPTPEMQQQLRDNAGVYSKGEVDALLQPLSYTESYYEHLLTPADLVNRIMSFDLAHEPKGAFDFLYIGSAPVSPASYRVVGTTLEIDQDTFDYELQSGRKILYRYTY